MEKWKWSSTHNLFMRWAQRYDIPVLTTNFDLNLSNSIGIDKIKHLDAKRFTYFYPWKSYFACSTIENPAREFGIWHINGLIDYPKSIRLGLSHYMGSVQRAREYIHRRSEQSLYAGKDNPFWKGYQTWMHTIFNCEIIIIGLGLKENEVFLRWLLIERARYYRRFPERFYRAYYVYSGDYLTHGQKMFFDAVGIEIIRSNSFAEIYEDIPKMTMVNRI